MKQMRSILAPLLMLLTGVLMTSCDDEQETAMMLWGTWEGQLSTEFYQDRWGGYGQTYYTVWHFEGKPGSRHGKGWEIDYVGHQRYAQHFDWQVIDDGRTVRLHYAGAWDDEWIYNFYLDDNYFTGYIDSGDGKQSFFQLERVEDNGYDYDTAIQRKEYEHQKIIPTVGLDGPTGRPVCPDELRRRRLVLRQLLERILPRR